MCSARSEKAGGSSGKIAAGSAGSGGGGAAAASGVVGSGCGAGGGGALLEGMRSAARVAETAPSLSAAGASQSAPRSRG